MASLVSVLPLLGCLLMCPLMMVFMMRGSRSKPVATNADESAELQASRATINELQSELANRDNPAS
jgi:hypothetical protein